ncbi:MAG TPA: helix-turn-helix domain-containing protein [Prolixibacteraceae bacterium]|nr:helix-turn-helix domain-containing protein [Prolixibacteraceae bacterium]HPS11892.1 helix-turn-helix domain-containing protein [Prolixibacteraceae bacterium]
MKKLKIAEKRERVRKSIIDVAKKVFTQLGYDKSSLNKIADELGKGKSTLYYYFNSKEDIFKEVLRMESESIWEQVKNEVAMQTDPREKIKTYMVTRMKAIKNKVNFSEALKNEMLHAYEFINQIRKDFNIREQLAIQNILDYGVAENIFAIKDTKLTAEAIAIALRGFEVPLITDFHTEEEIEEKIDEMLFMLFNGMLKR